MYWRVLLLALGLVLAGCQGVETAQDSQPTVTTEVSPAPTPSSTPTAATPSPTAPSSTIARSPPSVSRSNGTASGRLAPWVGSTGPNGTFSTLVVGSKPTSFDGTVSVVVWNDAPRPRHLDLAVAYGNETIYSATPRVPANQTVQFDLYQAGAYRFTATPANHPHLVLSPEEFDCNEQTHGLRVHPNGSVESSSISTMLGCP